MRGILFGNGLNLRFDIEQFSTSKIFDRFVANIKRYSDMYEAMFSVSLTEDVINELFEEHKDSNIEALAGYLYSYIKDINDCPIWSVNNEYMLQELITSIALLSIFYDNEGLIKPNIDLTKLPDIVKYDRVFTLNYVEFWDDRNICIPLHGKIVYNDLQDVPNAFFYNTAKYGGSEYKAAIEKMKLKGNAVLFDPFKYVFAPEGIKKQDLICIAGIFPSDRIFPGENLCPISPREIYKDLNSIDEIDVFGVSPYGDISLIDAINQMKFARVFVHEMNIKEIDEWGKLLKCPHEFLNSNDI